VAVDTERDRLARYANVAGGWLGLRCSGIEVGAQGELRLQRLPDTGSPYGPQVPAPADDAPAGCALDECGTGYLSVPDAGVVLSVSRCAAPDIAAGDVLPARSGDTQLLPGAFTRPRGMVRGPRDRLYVADSDAVLVVDLNAGALTSRWSDVTDGWALAATTESVYLLDRGGNGGTGRVRRFDADGVEDAAFTSAVAGLLPDPVRMALAGDVLMVVCRSTAADAVIPIRPDGSVDVACSAAWAAPNRVERDPISGKINRTPVPRISGIAGGRSRVYLLDTAHADLLTYTLSGEYIGATRPTQPLSDITDANPVVWGYPAVAGSATRHDVVGSQLRSGTFLCGPLDTATEHGRRELRAWVDRTGGAHVQFWTAVSQGAQPPSLESLPVGGVPLGTSWAALPANVEVGLLPEPTGPQLFIGGELAGSGSETPAVRQISVAGARPWLDRLPATYRKDTDSADFLDRYLRLVHSVHEELEQERADLVRRFDAWVADDTRPGRSNVLDELADWLDIVLDERWEGRMRRGMVAGAFAAQGLRGTPRGLLDAITTHFPGVRAEIHEPAQRASVWLLGGRGPANTCSCHGAPAGLGFDTMLSAGPPDGAVVGASAVVGQSELTGGADFGAPLFDDLAHRFHVCARPAPGANSDDLAADLRALVDADRPAHTVYTLCVAGPQARVGLQARIGVDLIVGEASEPFALGDTATLGRTALDAAADLTHAAGSRPAFIGQLRLGQGELT
jgi:phage tail-like protein